MAELSTKPNHGVAIGELKGQPIYLSDLYQDFFDDLEQKLNDNLLGSQVTLASYTVESLPNVTPGPSMIYVSNEAGGAVMAFSDGTNWRRSTDRQIVS